MSVCLCGGEVIAGFDLAVLAMAPGEKKVTVIPAETACMVSFSRISRFGRRWKSNSITTFKAKSPRFISFVLC